MVDIDPAKNTEGSLKDVFDFKIPAGAVTTSGKVTATVLNPDKQPAIGNYQALSPVVELSSTSGNTVKKPLALTFNFKKDATNSNKAAAVYYYNESTKKWIFLGGTESANTIAVDVSRFAKFAVFGYTPKTFADLEGTWVHPYSDRLIGMNVITGYNDQKFHPDKAITRAELVKIIAQATGLPSASGTTRFADDDKIPSWAKSEVMAAIEAGYINGIAKNGAVMFEADQPITRAEIAVIIANILKSSVSSSEGSQPFKDAASIPAWAKSSVDKAMATSILNGYGDNTFRPNNDLTRAEATKIVFMLLQALNI
jgi:hypothetical protein